MGGGTMENKLVLVILSAIGAETIANRMDDTSYEEESEEEEE